MAAGETPQGGELPVEQPYGLLLSGEGVPFLTDEHRTLLTQIARSFAGGKAVELSVVGDPTTEGETDTVSVQAEQEAKPVPATYEDFHSFAAAHGYTDQRAAKAYTQIAFTQEIIENDGYSGEYADILRSYPPIRILGEDHRTRARHKIIDLRSVYDRFVAADFHRKAWDGASPNSVAFIAELVNEFVQPDELLPTDPTFYRHYRWRD